MIDRKLLLDTVGAESERAGHDTAIVDEDVKRKATLQELLGCVLTLVHVVQVQGDEIKVGLAFEVWVFCLDLGLGLLDGLEGLAHGAAGEKDVCTFGGEGDGCGEAQARVGAGDDGDLACEVWDILVDISGSVGERLPVCSVEDDVGVWHGDCGDLPCRGWLKTGANESRASSGEE